MPVGLVAVAFDADDPARLAAFWAAVLGRRIIDELNGALLPGDETQVGLRFAVAATEKSGQNRLHLHLTSSTLEDERRRSRPCWISGVATSTSGNARRRITS